MTGRPPSHHLPNRDRWHIVPVVALVLVLLASPLAIVSASTGPATEMVHGIVYDEHGVPAEGVLVHLDDTYVGAPTDEGGEFTLSGPELDGDRVLSFHAEGFMTAMIDYSLEDGGSLEVSVYLVEQLLEPASVEGTVLSFTGEPIEGALVILELEDGIGRSALTDVHGRYSINEIPPTEVPISMTVEAPGHMTQVLEANVEPGWTSVLDVTMAPETPMELVRGRVLDGRGLPLPGVKVVIDGSWAEWTTDLDGRFSALLDGRLQTRNVSVNLRGYADAMVAVSIPEPGLADVDISMNLLSEGGPETLWVHVLNDWTEDPVVGAIAAIVGTEGEWTTDTQGTAIITGTGLEGSVTLDVTKPSHTSASASIEMEDGGTGVLTLRITRASNAVTLEGLVIDGASGRAIADAQVIVNSGGIVWLTMTGLDGGFHVHNLPPGVATSITVFADGYAMSEVITTLEEYSDNGLVIQLDILVPSTATVSGLVSEGNVPLADVRITMWTGGGFMAVVTTDAAGEYSQDDVPAIFGELFVRFEHPDHSTAFRQVPLPEDGGHVILDLVMEDYRTLPTVVQGYVLDPDGYSVTGAKVTINTGTTELETLTIAGHFSFLVQIKEAMNVNLFAIAERHGHNSRSAIIVPNGHNWVNLTIPLGPDHGNLLGTVRTVDQRPVEDAEVQLAMGGAYRHTTITESDGTFAFLGVPASDRQYQLSVLVEGFDGITMEAVSEAGRTTRYHLVVEEDVTSVETIQGTITSNEGLPVANAVVRIGGGWNVVTDANGTFVLVDESLEGRWSVTASLSGFENTFEIVEVLSGETVAVDLVLDVMDAEATSVGGSVLKASNGKPLEGATVRLARSASSTWTFETTTGADGAFTFRGVPLAWDAVAVTVTFPGYHDDVARTMLSTSEATQLEFFMQKVVQPQPDEPMLTGTEARQVGAGVTITVGAIIIILMTEVGRVALLGLILVPLYTKIKREKVMDHFVRGRIYEFVCQNPGVNYSAIKAQFKLTNGTVTYHLSMLERQEFIRAKQDGIYKRYFSNNGGPSPSDVEPMSLQLTIARAIREHPGMTQKEIAKHLGSSKQLVSYHIRRMKKDEQLETRRDGRSVRVYPNHLTPE